MPPNARARASPHPIRGACRPRKIPTVIALCLSRSAIPPQKNLCLEHPVLISMHAPDNHTVS